MATKSKKYYTDLFKVVIHLWIICVNIMLLRLFVAALLSPAGKALTTWFLFVMFNCVIVSLPCGILGQVWYLIVSIPIFAASLTFIIFLQKSCRADLKDIWYKWSLGDLLPKL